MTAIGSTPLYFDLDILATETVRGFPLAVSTALPFWSVTSVGRRYLPDGNSEIIVAIEELPGGWVIVPCHCWSGKSGQVPYLALAAA